MLVTLFSNHLKGVFYLLKCVLLTDCSGVVYCILVCVCMCVLMYLLFKGQLQCFSTWVLFS